MCRNWLSFVSLLSNFEKVYHFKIPRNWCCKVFQVTYANNSQLIWNVKSHFKEFLQAKMACVSKLSQAKVWFLLANVQLTTVSVRPWVKALSNFMLSILAKMCMYHSMWSGKPRMELTGQQRNLSTSSTCKHLQQSSRWLSSSYTVAITIDGTLKRVTCVLSLRITVTRLFYFTDKVTKSLK